jgi:hypothetical protein
VSNQVVRLSVQASVEKLKVRIEVDKKKSCELEIPVSSIVELFTHHKPLLFASFLGELVLNKFSDDTMVFIMDAVAFNLPGVTKHSNWRSLFIEETPVAFFILNAQEHFRGPVYCVHKFFNGIYYRLKLFISSSYGLSIQFGKSFLLYYYYYFVLM